MPRHAGGQSLEEDRSASWRPGPTDLCIGGLGSGKDDEFVESGSWLQSNPVGSMNRPDTCSARDLPLFHLPRSNSFAYCTSYFLLH